MAWRRPGDKPLSGPMMVSLLTHICIPGLNELTYLKAELSWSSMHSNFAPSLDIVTLRSEQKGPYFEKKKYFKWIFLTEKKCILIQTLLKFGTDGPIGNQKL